MENLVFNLLTDLRLNLIVSGLCVLSYLVNYLGLKLKKEYRGFRHQIFLVLLLPGFNFLFLLFNVMLFSTSIGGYRVIKVRVKKKAKNRSVPARA